MIDSTREMMINGTRYMTNVNFVPKDVQSILPSLKILEQYNG